MHCKVVTLSLIGVLTGCGSAAPVRTATVQTATVRAPEPDMTQTRATPRPMLSTEILPSMSRNAVLTAATPLLQRPVAASVVVRSLQAGDTVQLLGDLDNADGRWLSVANAGEQGWIRAAAIAP